MGMSTGGDSKEGMNEINVTPLIDIMLVMLIIFMLITPPKVSQMQAKLPENTETVEQDSLPQKQLVVAVCEDGMVALNTKKMPLPELAEEIGKRLRGRKDKVVFVDGHPDAPYDKVVELMDTVKESGAEKLGLASLKEPDEFRACTAPTQPAAPADGAAAPPAAAG